MPRARFNVLVLPYRLRDARPEFAVHHRPESDTWQFIAGGGEGGETPFVAARREAREEGGIVVGEDRWLRLDASASIPRTAFPDAPWPDDVYVVPEHCFAVEVGDADLPLSPEHDRFLWLDYETTRERLTWDSNKVALWELRERLARQQRRA